MYIANQCCVRELYLQYINKSVMTDRNGVFVWMLRFFVFEGCEKRVTDMKCRKKQKKQFYKKLTYKLLKYDILKKSFMLDSESEMRKDHR